MTRSEKYRNKFTQCRGDRWMLYLATAVAFHGTLFSLGLFLWRLHQTAKAKEKPQPEPIEFVYIQPSATPTPVVVPAETKRRANVDSIATGVKRPNQPARVGAAGSPKVAAANPTNSAHKFMAVKPIPPLPQLTPPKPASAVQPPRQPSKSSPPTTAFKTTKTELVKKTPSPAKPSPTPSLSRPKTQPKVEPKKSQNNSPRRLPSLPPKVTTAAKPLQPKQPPAENGQGLDGRPNSNRTAAGPDTVDAVQDKIRADYILSVRRKVLNYWMQYSQTLSPDTTRHALVKIVISANGQLSACEVVQSSEWEPADQAAIQAVQAAAPFDPLPPELPGTSLEIKMNFEYNVHQEEGGEMGR